MQDTRVKEMLEKCVYSRNVIYDEDQECYSFTMAGPAPDGPVPTTPYTEVACRVIVCGPNIVAFATYGEHPSLTSHVIESGGYAGLGFCLDIFFG